MEIEKLIETYLTRCGKVFISSQYDVAWSRKRRDGGSCPDVVCLDFSRTPREVVVVEVTTAVDLKSVLKKVRERETRWYDPLRRSLLSSGIIDESWEFRFLGFVRSDHEIMQSAERAFPTEMDVWFYPIEEAMLPHSYWKVRMRDGLPRRPLKLTPLQSGA